MASNPKPSKQKSGDDKPKSAPPKMSFEPKNKGPLKSGMLQNN
jgi:hypothetical protein